MAGKAQDSEFRHPEVAAFLQGSADEQASRLPPLVLEHDGVVTRQRHEGGRVCCREVEASSEMDALHAAADAEFGRSLPRLKAELQGGGIPDLDALETSVRDGMPSCGRRMERHGRSGKTLQSRLGPVRGERTRFRCRECGGGFHPLDRALGLEGNSVTPGAESIHAAAASSDSCGTASRKLRNLAGVEVPKSTLRCHGVRIGQEI